MSEEGKMTLMRLANGIFGVIIFVLGLLLTYFSLRTDIGIVNPRIFTPIGLAVAVVGGLMILAGEA